MTEDEVLRRTKQFLIENFMYMRRSKELNDDDALLQTGVITSLGVMELVDWIEDTFAMKVDPSDITEQNFESPRSIARFVIENVGAPARV